jgi:hypothetical protein
MKTSRNQHLSILVAVAIAGSGLAAVATSAASTPSGPDAGSINTALDYTSYRQCLAAENSACLFPGPLGPELPETPEEEVIYAQCLEDAAALCASLFPPA